MLPLNLGVSIFRASKPAALARSETKMRGARDLRKEWRAVGARRVRDFDTGLTRGVIKPCAWRSSFDRLFTAQAKLGVDLFFWIGQLFLAVPDLENTRDSQIAMRRLDLGSLSGGAPT